jgi:hypothetical protein
MATWPATTHELIGLQHALGEMTPEPWQPPTTLSRIGACFACFEPSTGLVPLATEASPARPRPITVAC